MHAKSLHSRPTICNPMSCSPPGSFIHGFSRQEYWSGFPFPSPWDLPNPGIELGSPAWQAYSLPSELQGSPLVVYINPKNNSQLVKRLTNTNPLVCQI